MTVSSRTDISCPSLLAVSCITRMKAIYVNYKLCEDTILQIEMITSSIISFADR